MANGYVPDEQIMEFPALSNGCRVRVLKRTKDSAFVLDIRQYVASDEFTGFTKRGVRLGAVDVVVLRDLLASPALQSAMGIAANPKGVADGETTGRAVPEDSGRSDRVGSGGKKRGG